MKKKFLRLTLMGIALMFMGINTAMADDGDVILHETFDNSNGTGGNDNQWSGSIAASPYSLSGWTFEKPYKGDRCVKLATGSAKGSIKTPTISFESGKTYTLMFRAGAWSSDATNLKVSYGETALVSSLALTQGEFNTYVYPISATGANYIKIETTGKKRCFVDDIMIVEGAKINVTIASSGWSTLSTPVGLDFSGVAGLTAFAATAASASSITLTSIDEAPAATGVVLKGTAGTTYSIPIKAAATLAETNKLSAATSAEPVDADEVYILKNGQFCLVDAGGSSVPYGKAYLKATEIGGGARELTINFGDETAIQTLENSNKVNDGVIYDLSGRRVENPTKGIYIMNGKKFVVK